MLKLVYCPSEVKEFINSLEFPGETNISISHINSPCSCLSRFPCKKCHTSLVNKTDTSNTNTAHRMGYTGPTGYTGSMGYTGYVGYTGPVGYTECTGCTTNVRPCVKTKINWLKEYKDKYEYAESTEIIFNISLNTSYIPTQRMKVIKSIAGENMIYSDICKTEKIYPRLKHGVSELLEQHKKFNSNFDRNKLLRNNQANDWNVEYVEYSTECLQLDDKNYLQDMSTSRIRIVPNEYTNTHILFTYTLAELQNQCIKDTFTQVVNLLC